jgi:uncharacterized membrane protein
VNNILELMFIAFRLILALALLGFLPGFALSWWLFSKSRVDLLERFFVSAITSLVLSGFAAYGLIVSGMGVSPSGMVLLLGVITLIFTVGAVHARQWQGTLKQIVSNRWNRVLRRLRKDMPLAILSGVFGVAMIIGGAFHLRMAQNMDTLSFTEFYISPSNLAVDGVSYAIENGTLKVPVTIVNNEGQDRVYRIESVISKDTGLTAGQMYTIMPILYADSPFTDQIAVADLDRWSGIVSVELPDNPVDFVEINLFYVESHEPYAALRIWLSDS